VFGLSVIIKQAYQRLLDVAPSADSDEAVRQSLAHVAQCAHDSAKTYSTIRRKYAISGAEPPTICEKRKGEPTLECLSLF
jgi:hypothetical protein